MEGSFLSKKMIIVRHLGEKHIKKGSEQWQVLTDKKDECWRCNHHILTIFLWTPRIGAITSEKEPEKIEYYRNKMN